MLSQGRKPQRQSKAAETSSAKSTSKKPVEVEIPKLKSEYGVDAWKRWIQWRQTQPNLENPRFGCKSEYKIHLNTAALRAAFPAFSDFPVSVKTL